MNAREWHDQEWNGDGADDGFWERMFKEAKRLCLDHELTKSLTDEDITDTLHELNGEAQSTYAELLDRERDKRIGEVMSALESAEKHGVTREEILEMLPNNDWHVASVVAYFTDESREELPREVYVMCANYLAEYATDCGWASRVNEDVLYACAVEAGADHQLAQIKLNNYMQSNFDDIDGVGHYE